VYDFSTGGIVKYVIGILVGFGVLFLIVGGTIPLWMGLRFVWHGLNCSRWPTTTGVVVKAAISESEAGSKGNRYQLAAYTFFLPKLSFSYQVNGHSYTTENLQFGRAEGSGDASEAALLMLRYPVGAKVKIHYHPSNPSLAVVRPGVYSDIVWYFVAGVSFILFGVVAGLGYLSTVRDILVFHHVMGLMWLIFIMLGIGMLAPGLLNLWRAKASQNWPTVNGVIVFSEKEMAKSAIQHSEGKTYVTDTNSVPLAYQYEVNGEKHYSNVRHFGQFVGSSEESWSDAIFKRYPTGTQVPVTYCPADPDVAALESGIHPETWFLPGGGAAFLLFGLLALYMFERH
jgi:hypothetical protein